MRKDLANLEADQETERHCHCCISTVAIVDYALNLHVSEGDECTAEANENRPHSENRRDEQIVHEGVDATILHHPVIHLVVIAFMTEPVTLTSMSRDDRSADDRLQIGEGNLHL